MCMIAVILILISIKLISYLTNVRCKSKVCLVGKTALITGGNSGLGLQLAKELASRGCKVIIVDKADGSRTVKNLIKETHNSQIFYRHADFASFKSVRLFAEQLKKEINELHILANNAGIGVGLSNITQDGIQEIMQINYFSHFLLTHLLLDLLLKSAPSRIIFTSSVAAYEAPLTESNIKEVQGVTPLSTGSYGSSKLAGAIMSSIFACKLKGTGVTSYAFHPGLVKTNIWKLAAQAHNSIWVYFCWAVTYIFGKNTEEGAQTMLHLACSDNIEHLSGKFFMECTPVWQPYKVYDKDFCQKIWNISEKTVELNPEEKLEIILKNNKSNN